ncbi:hypothetical protein ACG33_07870 [Steroidobacter denitrificans]|uniref:Uncharacterized protein n=1 Tax=Steroidobacter denitrificans TaxID=465721 RepID=A0A127F9C0_STEDE|nr:hypothetical protein [Steroidobacter denitrificans]AMN47014.1 hypothetical protein ACG33_07870 [Steroidobacter denitrificans]
MIRSLYPDTIVIATGSTPRRPHDTANIGLPHVIQGWDVLAGKVRPGSAPREVMAPGLVSKDFPNRAAVTRCKPQ